MSAGLDVAEVEGTVSVNFEDVDAVRRLHLQPRHPPEARAEGEDRDADARGERVSPRRLAQHDHRVEEPQDRCHADVDDGAGVDAAHGRHDGREQGRLAPPAATEGHDGQAQHEGQAGPGQEDDRDAPGVLEEVRREHVGERGGGRPGAAQPHDAREVQDAEPGGEENGPEPEALGHPDGHAEEVEDREERAHREEVADVLVGDRAESHRRVPHERRLTEEAGRVEVQVGLGVGRDDPGSYRQQGAVGHGGQRGGPADPPPAASPHARASSGCVPPPGGGDGGGRGHEEGAERSPGSVSRQRHPGVSPRLERPWPPAPRAA